MVYFLRNGRDGRIKIGTTIRLAVRVATLRLDHGPGLEILGIIDGDKHVERATHRGFMGLRAKDEWFMPGDRAVFVWPCRSSVGSAVRTDVLDDTGDRSARRTLRGTGARKRKPL